MDELDELISEVINDAKSVSGAYEWGDGVHKAESDLHKSRAALVAYVAAKDAEIERLRKGNKAWSNRARFWRGMYTTEYDDANWWWHIVRRTK